MKKGRSKAILCCLGLLMVANVSCVMDSQNELLRVEKVGNSQDSAEIFKVRKLSKSEEVVVIPDQEKTAIIPGKSSLPQTASIPSVAEVRRVPTKYNVYQYMPDTSKSLGTEILLSEMTKEIAGKVYYEMQEEGEKNITGKIAVVNAVPLSDLKRDTEFGRVIGEYLLTDLTDRGLKVTELRLGKDIIILPQTGEFILSRNVGELANKMPELEYVVVTTFANTRKTLVVQGRLVRLTDGAVKTSWRYSMPLNRELLGLFQPAEAPYKIAVKGIGR